MKNYVFKQFNGKEWIPLKSRPVYRQFNGKEWIELSEKETIKIIKQLK